MNLQISAAQMVNILSVLVATCARVRLIARKTTFCGSKDMRVGFL